MPAGVHDTGPGDAERQSAHVRGVHAVDVLVGIDGHEHGVEVDLRRRGCCTSIASTRRRR